MKRVVILAWALALSGCLGLGKHPEPEIRIVETKVPVPVPCKATVDVRETYSDAMAETATDIFEQVRLLLIGREERKEDAAKLKGAITGCGGTVQ